MVGRRKWPYPSTSPPATSLRPSWITVEWCKTSLDPLGTTAGTNWPQRISVSSSQRNRRGLWEVLSLQSQTGPSTPAHSLKPKSQRRTWTAKKNFSNHLRPAKKPSSSSSRCSRPLPQIGILSTIHTRWRTSRKRRSSRRRWCTTAIKSLSTC